MLTGTLDNGRAGDVGRFLAVDFVEHCVGDMGRDRRVDVVETELLTCSWTVSLTSSGNASAETQSWIETAGVSTSLEVGTLAMFELLTRSLSAGRHC